MKTVKEVSELTGISVRTLHYYDEIGLFRPTEVKETGYRFYDDNISFIKRKILLYSIHAHGSCMYFIYVIIKYLFIHFYPTLNRFMTIVVMMSFSFGSDSPIMRVIATRAPSLITLCPSLNNALFLFRNSRNNEAAIRLQPSAKG